MSYGSRIFSGRNYISRGKVIAVPADFVGMHFGGWPNIDRSWIVAVNRQYPLVLSPAPTGMRFGSYRSCACGFDPWYVIETSPGVYDFSGLAQHVSAHKAQGRTFVYTVWWAPTFYFAAGNPVISTSHPHAGYPDSTSPNGLTALYNFVSALLTYFNSPGGGWGSQTNGAGTNYSVWGKGIDEIEPQNEPGATVSDPFWQDTFAKLVDYNYTIKQARDATDPTVKLLSPGFSNPTQMLTYFNTHGAINTGVTGLSLAERIGIHCYGVPPIGSRLGNWGSTLSFADQLKWFGNFQTNIAAAGAGALDYQVTEWGVDGAFTSAELSLFNAASAAFRYRYVGRLLLGFACLGFKKALGFAYDEPFLGSFLMNDTNGAMKAFNDVHDNVAGKNIVDSYWDSTGAITAELDTGPSFSI